MAEKQQLSITIDTRLIEQLKVVSMYEKLTLAKLLEEAIQDVLAKYEVKWAKNADNPDRT